MMGADMHRLIQVTPHPEYRLNVRFADDVQGDVDLSHLAGRGVFSAWGDFDFFRNVSIGESGQLCWGNDIELCPDAIYMQITGKDSRDAFSDIQHFSSNA